MVMRCAATSDSPDALREVTSDRGRARAVGGDREASLGRDAATGAAPARDEEGGGRREAAASRPREGRPDRRVRAGRMSQGGSSSARFASVLLEESGEDRDDFVLLTAGELLDLVKDARDLSRWSDVARRLET